jgi:hypothetical protein
VNDNPSSANVNNAGIKTTLLMPATDHLTSGEVMAALALFPAVDAGDCWARLLLFFRRADLLD